MLLAIPVAWLQLAHQRVRFLATLGGIAFVVVLLFMQIGFREALFDSSIRVHQGLKGDLFVISRQYKSITSQQSFPRSRLYQTQGNPDVESVSPLYVQFGKLRNFQSGQKYSIFVFGIDPGHQTFILPDVQRNIDQLKLADRALFDGAARPEFGPIAQTFERQGKVTIEIADYLSTVRARQLEVRGLFTIGTSFGVDGNLMVNTSTFLDIFNTRNVNGIDVGLINLQPGADRAKVQKDLVVHLPDDVQILTREEFMQMEKNYWDLRTPAGFAFKIMVTMGFIIGIGIVYQILYNNIASHLIEFATLKAMGFTGGYLLKIVFQQACILAILGYIPGFLISIGMYDYTRDATQLPLFMTPDRIVFVLASVIGMCLVSGTVAIDKLRSVDPADIF
jgi:putative ABC transport system permease protein